MAELIRGLDQMLMDLDSRQRPGPPSRNRPIQKFASAYDTVGLTSDTITITLTTGPWLWAPASVGSTSQELAWNFGQWASDV